jgi:hypothetical protein
MTQSVTPSWAFSSSESAPAWKCCRGNAEQVPVSGARFANLVERKTQANDDAVDPDESGAELTSRPGCASRMSPNVHIRSGDTRNCPRGGRFPMSFDSLRLPTHEGQSMRSKA